MNPQRKYKMIAISDRPNNQYLSNQIYTGDTVTVWKDEDANTLYFVQSASSIFEMEQRDIIQTFGKLPGQP